MQPTLQPKVIFIPSFIAAALARNNRDIADILNYDIIKKCISDEDIILLMALNVTEAHNRLFYYTNVDEANVRNLVESDAIYSFWEQSCNDENINDLRNMYSRHILQQYMKDLDTRLFAGSRKAPESQEIPYSMADIQPNVYGVIINPGFFPDQKTSVSLIKDIIKAMYKYNQHFEIARTGLFRLYLDILD